MTIELKPEEEQVIGQAIQAGLIDTPAAFVNLAVEGLRSRLAGGVNSAPVLSDEWIDRFRSWACSHAEDSPLLSDHAISRGSIYGDRGI